VSGIVETPVIFAPPHILRSPWELADIYHELGHNVFRRHPEIAIRLVNAARDYYRALRPAVGLVNAAARAERDRAVATAANYWSIERLDELFCSAIPSFAAEATRCRQKWTFAAI
jgi:hypothetical protein